jgi:hypothetical protein
MRLSVSVCFHAKSLRCSGRGNSTFEAPYFARRLLKALSAAPEKACRLHTESGLHKHPSGTKPSRSRKAFHVAIICLFDIFGNCTNDRYLPIEV